MENILKTKRSKIPYYTYNTVIVGTGAAGYNAADTLFSLGQTDICIVTEGINMGTSRNTGSDKQTYYKLTTSGDERDSVHDMAKTLFGCGSVNGDTALIEAANSLRSFYKLVNLGVPFPTNEYGEHIGYRTDHDETRRATSAGPLTSKYMTECLERAVLKKHIPIYDGFRVIKIFTEYNRAFALLALDKKLISRDNPFGMAVFAFTNIIWATGGPSAIYNISVYPESQTCAHGVAFKAGASGVNLTESQYGLASVKFRWNLSGTYQQVIPRYVSTDKFGKDEREFLNEHFSSDSEMINAIFGKGYHWPFDPQGIFTSEGRGPSVIDIAVFLERLKGRRVFLDYTHNPVCAGASFNFGMLKPEGTEYLKKSGALLATPIERLAAMNEKAITLFGEHGIDLSREMLEIDVCAQHNNGGFEVNTDWESPTCAHFFPVGECAGTFGIRRPGGTALNSTQVGSLRAALKIASSFRCKREPAGLSGNIKKEINDVEENLDSLVGGNMKLPDIMFLRSEYGKKMSACAAYLRSYNSVVKLIREVGGELEAFDNTYSVSDPALLSEVAINRDVLLTQYIYLCAIRDYIDDGGLSRGSYLITDLPAKAILAGELTDVEADEKHFSLIQRVLYKDGKVASEFVPVRPIPATDDWFEKLLSKSDSEDKD